MHGATKPRASRQPTIRELVGVLAQRRGVDAALLLGSDGLVIESRTAPGVDGDHLGAHIPRLVAMAEDLGAQTACGRLVAGVIEFERGVAVVTSLTADTLLLVLLQAETPVGPLLFELRRHRANIASIV